MCGRFGFTIPKPQAIECFHLAEADEYSPHHNIMPGTDIPVILRNREGERVLKLLLWGLIPFWAKPDFKAKLINARAETAASKPSFRAPFKYKRCLIPADRFYEWKAVQGQKKKQPYAITLKDEQPFALAGLWDAWKKSEKETIFSCTILTTAPNALIAPIHDRMPVILPEDSYTEWLSPETSPHEAQELTTPYPAEEMTAEPTQL